MPNFKVKFKAWGRPRFYVGHDGLKHGPTQPVESAALEIVPAVSKADARDKAERIAREWLRRGDYIEIKFSVTGGAE